MMIKAIKFLGVSSVEGMTENGLGRIIILLMIQSVDTSKIGDAAFCADRSAEAVFCKEWL